MANQSYRVTGNKRLQPDQSADLAGRMTGLPNLLELKERRKEQADLVEFRDKQLAQEKSIADQEMSFEKDMAKKEFGLEMVKTGVNVGTGLTTDKTFSQYGTDFKNTFMSPQAPQTRPDMANPMSTPQSGVPITKDGTSGTPTTGGGNGSFFKKAGKLQPGSMISGGLAGFGLGSMFSDKSQEKRMLYGAGAGLLTGFLSGGIGGGISGGIGGLFGGWMS